MRDIYRQQGTSRCLLCIVHASFCRKLALHEGGLAQVWAEVQHCEERVQLLCTIARAVETHVSILQDELCKAGPPLLME